MFVWRMIFSENGSPLFRIMRQASHNGFRGKKFVPKLHGSGVLQCTRRRAFADSAAINDAAVAKNSLIAGI
jgi:hypothetical protein